MSIASEITRISGKVSDSFDAVVAKGGTVTTRKIADLPTAIGTISGGTPVPETQYGVNIKGWCGDIGSNGYTRTNQASGTLSMPNLQKTREYEFYCRFIGSTGLAGTVDLSGLKEVSPYSFREAFHNTNITGVSLGDLDYVGDNGFEMAFANTQITSFSIKCDNFSFYYSFTLMCGGCANLRTINLRLPASVFIALMEDSGETLQGVFGMVLAGLADSCTNCVIHLYSGFWQEINQYIIDKGETPEYATESDWATFLLSIFGCGANCSIVFDLT